MAKFIFFDVGGVLLKDFSANNGWNELKNTIGLTPEKFSDFDAYWSAMAERICTTTDVDTLISEINERFQTTMSPDMSLLSEFVNRFELSPVMQDVCTQVASSYQVGLLTNMYPRMLDEIMGRNIMPICSWDIVIDSSVVGVAKPSAEIFQIAEAHTGCKPNDITFIDNTNEHLEAATARGWNVLYFDPQRPEMSATRILKKLC